jgi:cysteine desulfurase
MKYLQKIGFALSLIPVDHKGIVDPAVLQGMISKDTIIASIMYANPEIGTVEPIREIGGIVHEKGRYLHVDATAATGKIPIDVQKDDIDILTISSNDIYGPQGAGALYIKPV